MVDDHVQPSAALVAGQRPDGLYLNDYDSMVEARQRIGMFIGQYNSIRPHASLEGLTPDMVYFGTKDLTQAI